MKKALLLLGNFTFHHFSDEELEKHFGGKDQIESPDRPMCLVHKLDEIKMFEDVEEALNEGEELLNKHESYLVAPRFNGRLAFERKIDKQYFEELKKDTLDRIKD
jgi:hypothetical protein